MRAGDAVMECLKAEGVEVVFGLPGGANLPTYDAFVDELTERLADPALLNDKDKFREAAREHSELTNLAETARELESVRTQLSEARQMMAQFPGFLQLQAGLLDGREVVTHWHYAELLQRLFPRLRVLHDARLDPVALPFERVTVTFPDSDVTPYDKSTSSSRLSERRDATPSSRSIVSTCTKRWAASS